MYNPYIYIITLISKHISKKLIKFYKKHQTTHQNKHLFPHLAIYSHRFPVDHRGLDVFATEPIPKEDPILKVDRGSSHEKW